MRMRRLSVLFVVWISGFVLCAGAAVAQTGLSGTIAGVARDATGAVLPGVTVEASSPVLIEKVRTVVTNDQGQYRIVDLRPGTYTVTFSLPGFSTVSREGVELTTGFTATVNAELRVGSVEETVTVTGASPIVDVQNVRTQNVVTRELLDTIPVAKNIGSFAAVTVGVSGGRAIGGGVRDVGGSRGETLSGLEVRGDRQGTPTIEGLQMGAMILGGDTSRFALNQLMAQEIVIETSGAGAETVSGGANINIVLRDGGNVFRGVVNGDYTGRDLQSNNLSDALRARGLTQSNVVTKLYDIGGGFGGPIVQDTLWFYTAHRWWGGVTEVAGKYYNKTQDTLFYTPDLSRPGTSETRSATTRCGSRGRRHRSTRSRQRPPSRSIASVITFFCQAVRPKPPSNGTSSRTISSRPCGRTRPPTGCCSRPARPTSRTGCWSSRFRRRGTTRNP